MKLNYISADSRGEVDHGWLKSAHTYSFGHYHDENRMGFGALRVVNDDSIDGGQGFGKHAHNNMEIVSIGLEGQISHGDNMGNKTLINAGEIQAMTAGTGVIHSEMNASASESAKFFQIWIETRDRNIRPAYSQKKFEKSERVNKWQLVVAPDTATEDVVKIYQDAWIYLGDFVAGRKAIYSLKDGTKNGVFLMVIEGEVTVGEQVLMRRDAVEITEVTDLEIEIGKDARLLLMEVPL
ncbi:pirin family protein [Candidatus Peregrinibacteria bacterium]|nr:pirin family protein [Candidatus Peregrinibacteria bacterium]